MRLAAAGTGRRWLPALALGIACGAQAAPPADPLAWLARAARASRDETYAGTFVHSNGERTSTVRVTHVSSGGDENERIEALDGPPYEIVRRNEEMFCYFPDAKTIRLDRQLSAHFFPSIFHASTEAIARSYDVKLGKSENVLGYDCQWISLQPKDALRFPQRLCSEAGTGLVLRSKTLDLQGHVIEQYTFTDLKMGQHVARAPLRAAFEARVRQWMADAQPREAATAMHTGWIVTQAPAGFTKVTELERTLPGRPKPVSQLIYSDGLATLSVFVEPNGPAARSAEAATEDGTTTFFVHPMGDQVVTVLGEVPLATAQQFGRSVAHSP
jgi:sigma-E factor negative regulatory protein RseB